MRKIILTIFTLVLLLGCDKYTEPSLERKVTFLATMDLGSELWKNKILKYNGDIKKADSAYNVEKVKLMNKVYRDLRELKKSK